MYRLIVIILMTKNQLRGIIICLIIVAFVTMNALVITSYQNYMAKTEKLLDHIWEIYPILDDTVAEGDIYYDYLEARENIISFE